MKIAAIVLTFLVTFLASYPAFAIRNMNTVIPGKLYISGGSSGRRPLNQKDLVRLCDEGFTVAFYVYRGGTNKTVSCGGGRTLRYINDTNWQNPNSILNQSAQAIGDGGKVLVHCWNGIHASRFVAAVALNKFCGFQGEEAAEWWRSGFSKASLGHSRIALLSQRLNRLGRGHGGMAGCPSP